jgi:hypothetical protein
MTIIGEFHNRCLQIQEAVDALLQEYKIQEALDALFEDEDLSEDELGYIVGEILIPKAVIRFAEHYSEMDDRYDYDPSEDNLNNIFQTWCSFEHLSDDLADAVTTTINTLAEEDSHRINLPSQKDGDSEDAAEEDDDNNVVFKPEDWSKLSDEERKAKVKTFLRKLAAAHIDARELKPFLKNLNVGDQSNPYGVKVGDKVKMRTSHDPRNEAIQFPNLFHQDHEDPRSHPLHQTLVNHAYEYSHTTPVSQRDGSVHRRARAAVVKAL